MHCIWWKLPGKRYWFCNKRFLYISNLSIFHSTWCIKKWYGIYLGQSLYRAYSIQIMGLYVVARCAQKNTGWVGVGTTKYQAKYSTSLDINYCGSCAIYPGRYFCWNFPYIKCVITVCDIYIYLSQLQSYVTGESRIMKVYVKNI